MREVIRQRTGTAEAGRRPHVLQVINTLQVGGAEADVVRLSNGLASMGLRVTVATEMSGSQLSDQLDPSVAVLQLPFAQRAGALWSNFVTLPRVTAGLATYMSREQVDVVHTRLLSSGLPAWLAASRWGIPVLHTLVHVFASPGVGSRAEWGLYRSGLVARLVPRFHALSRYLAHELEDMLSIPPGRISLVRAGVDTDRFRPGDPEATRGQFGLPVAGPLLGICSRLERVKNVDLALAAFARLDPALGARLVIAGDGSQREALARLATELGVRERVHFLGTVSETSALLPAFDMFLQTTQGPNLGTSVLEAMACGIPLIIAARDAAEIRMAEDTLVDGRGGNVCTADPQALAEAATALLRAPAELAARSRAARSTAERCYSWTNHLAGMTELYHSMIGGGAAAQHGGGSGTGEEKSGTKVIDAA